MLKWYINSYLYKLHLTINLLILFFFFCIEWSLINFLRLSKQCVTLIIARLSQRKPVRFIWQFLKSSCDFACCQHPDLDSFSSFRLTEAYKNMNLDATMIQSYINSSFYDIYVHEVRSPPPSPLIQKRNQLP